MDLGLLDSVMMSLLARPYETSFKSITFDSLPRNRAEFAPGREDITSWWQPLLRRKSCRYFQEAPITSGQIEL